ELPVHRIGASICEPGRAGKNQRQSCPQARKKAGQSPPFHSRSDRVDLTVHSRSDRVDLVRGLTGSFLAGPAGNLLLRLIGFFKLRRASPATASTSVACRAIRVRNPARPRRIRPPEEIQRTT